MSRTNRRYSSVAKYQIWTRFARIFLDGIVDARISPGIAFPVSKSRRTKGERERERGTKFRLGSLFHFDAHMRTLLALHMLKWHG